MNARELTRALGGRWHGTYGTARCPAHDDRDPSLSVRDGEAERLLIRCHAGCTFAAVRDALAGLGLWPEAGRHVGRPHGRDARQRAREAQREAEERADQVKHTASALLIWRASAPAAGTIIETYLRSRSIVLAPPPILRFHPALRHGPTGLRLPCMVAGVQSAEGRITAVQRTYLRADGAGKADVPNPKLALGPCAGGAVRLAKAGSVLAIGEGIESTLAYMQLSSLPGWAAVSAPGLAGLILPNLPCAARVVIAADHDDAGLAAAERSAKGWTAEGRKVRIAPPPEPGADWNDRLKGRRNDAA
ncbi:MAG: toprim domain-containing protein [Alphaproteobacteria bacterium]